MLKYFLLEWYVDNLNRLTAVYFCDWPIVSNVFRYDTTDLLIADKNEKNEQATFAYHSSFSTLLIAINYQSSVIYFHL